jgi:hypothetical protein
MPSVVMCWLIVLCVSSLFLLTVNFFPHSVADLEVTLTYLQQQNPQEFETWETRYALLLWMSILVKIPFDLASVDSHFGTTATVTTSSASASASSSSTLPVSGSTATAAPTATASSLFSTLVSLAQRYLSDAGATRDMAAVLLSKLFLRADAQGKWLAQFVTWACEQLQSSATDQFLV